MTEYWIQGVFRTSEGKPASIMKRQGGSFELDGGSAPVLFYYTNTGSKGHPSYTVTLAYNGFHICSAGRLKDAKARAEELLPRILKTCSEEDSVTRNARSFQDLCKRAEELGVAML